MSAAKHQRAADNLNSRIGRTIRNRRVQLGLSQAALGKAIGVTHQQIQKYEKGSNEPTIARLMEIASTLGWPVCHLLSIATEEAAREVNDVSDRAAMELMKRFLILKPHERRGVVQLVQNLARAA